MRFRVATARPLDIDAERLGIATDYAGTRFRSRVEARWAAFFDQIRWPWAYEALDLSGYVPDFVILFPGRAHLLVEVKASLDYRELEPHARKICLSGWRSDFLVVGARLFDDQEPIGLGLYGMWDRESGDGWHPADRAEALDCGICGRVSFRHASAGWECFACGSRLPHAARSLASREALRGRWASAGNAVQWRASGAEEAW